MALEGYSNLDRVHEGGQAIIYRARMDATGTPVVIKVLRVNGAA